MDALDLKSQMQMVQCDVSDAASVSAAAKSVEADLQIKGERLYALVNNAGIGPNQGDFNQILSVNYEGVKLVSEERNS